MAWITALLLAACMVCVVEPKTFRWCAKENEMKKCEDFMKVIPKILNKTAGVSAVMETKCVKGNDEEDCMKKIQNNEADFITLDGGHLYTAGKEYELVPIVAEKVGNSTGYFGVAVAKKNTVVDFNNLKGKKTCHTAYGRTSGWVFPIGMLLQKDGFRTGCGDNIDVKSASKYFSESCVPGVPSGYPNLCALCPGKSCSTDGKYTGYNGAFKCMMEGGGDVAFVKHTTTKDSVGNYTKDYKYLCTDGKTKDVTPTAHVNCNLGQSVSHTVVTRSGDNTDYIKILVEAGNLCSSQNAECDNFLMFDSSKYGKTKDLLFKDKATELVDVGKKNTYTTWLGEDYAKDFEALKKKGPVCAFSVMIAAYPSLLVTMLALAKTLL